MSTYIPLNARLHGWQAPKLLACVLLVLGACSSSEEPSAAYEPIHRPPGWLLNTWGPSQTNLFVVGGTPEAGRVDRYDGAAWSPVPLPAETPLLAWMWGWSGDTVFVVGARGTVLRGQGQGVAMTWTKEPVPTTQDLWGVWGTSEADVWAVGGNGLADGDATLLHRTPSGWQAVPVPPLQRALVRAFYKVWGTSASDVWVVGQSGAVLHFDGITWTERLVGTGEDLISLWGVGERLVVVGGRTVGVVATFDGQTWNTRSLPAVPGLNGIWMRDADHVHVAGTNGFTAHIDFKSLDVAPHAPITALDLHAVFGTPDGALVAVGGNLLSTRGPFEGVALQRALTETE